jgi:hypothetical protein
MIPRHHGKDGQYEVTVPSWSDKLVGEVVRLLLEAYYEPGLLIREIPLATECCAVRGQQLMIRPARTVQEAVADAQPGCGAEAGPHDLVLQDRANP